jgi:hypothetical protein
MCSICFQLSPHWGDNRILPDPPRQVGPLMIPSAAVDLLPPAARRTAPFHRRDGMQTVEHVRLVLEGADGRLGRGTFVILPPHSRLYGESL